MRILWLKTELLHPVDKGGKIRTYHMLKELKRAGHHITYLTLDDGAASSDAAERAYEYCNELVRVPFRAREKFSAGFYAELALNLLSPLPYAIRKYQSTEMRREISKRTSTSTSKSSGSQNSNAAFDVLVCDFLTPCVNVPEDVKCAIVLFQHNVEAMIWKRHYEVQQNPLKKAYLYDQWRKTFSFEKRACQRFDSVIAVSSDDAETMRRDYGVKSVADVPTGVDTEFFHSSGAEKKAPHNLVFTGSMDWLPNEDAIRFFTAEIMPRIKEKVPGVTLTVVGRKPYESLLQLAARDASVTVTGRVEDVRPYMEQAAAYIVPIRIGGGTRLKIYEALVMDLPMISTTIGAEGLPLRDGVELMFADTPQAFADAVVRVLTDTEFARELGKRAGQIVRERFGWNGVATKFADLCERAIAARAGSFDARMLKENKENAADNLRRA